MSQQIQISASLRQQVGTAASRRMRRRSDEIPGVIYGGEAAPQLLSLNIHELSRVMQHEAFHAQILNVVVEGAAEQAVVRDLQRDPASERVLHIDFLRVSADRPIQVQVPLHFINEHDCEGVRMGGNISHNITEVEVSCLPKHLPEFIEVDVAALELGETLHLTDLVPPAEVSIVALMYGEERNIPVVSVQAPRGGAGDLEEEDEEEAGIESAAPGEDAGDETP